jgi:hypothetical protein
MMESPQELRNCGHSKAQRLSFRATNSVSSLSTLIQAKPEQASMQNPLCEIAMTKKGPAPVFPDKLGAAARLAKLTGWNSVEKVSVEAGENLASFLGRLFVGGGTLSSNGGENGERSKQTSGSAAIRQ